MCARSSVEKDRATTAQEATKSMRAQASSPNSLAASSRREANSLQEAGLVAKSMTLREDQYRDIVSLSAFNKLLRKKPDSVSGVIREAIDLYLSKTDDSFRRFASELSETSDD